jgi:hypothetical protein
MPKVGKKEFSYSKAGKQAAKDFAKESGEEVSYFGGGMLDAGNMNQNIGGGGIANVLDARNRSQNLDFNTMYDKGGTIYERNQAERERIAAASKKAAGERTEKREKRKQKKVDTLAEKRDAAKESGNIRKYKRLQNRINRRLDKKAPTESGRHTKASAEKVIKKHKEGKSWEKATSAAKKQKLNLSGLVKARKNFKKDSTEYKNIQNKINELYGVKKRHLIEKKVK